MRDLSPPLVSIDLFSEEINSEDLTAEVLPETAATNTLGTASCIGSLTGTASSSFCAFTGVG